MSSAAKIRITILGGGVEVFTHPELPDLDF